jgi:thiamine kinase-like enzyme
VDAVGGRFDGTVYASLIARFRKAGLWDLKRICWSWQSTDDNRFHAVTLFYYAQSGDVELYVFPDDRGLAAIGPHRDADVLRYVPGRRLTFREVGTDGQPVVGKCLRTPMAAVAYGKLVNVFTESRRSPSLFSVPRPLGIDECDGLFFQEAKPGDTLARQLTEDNYTDLLHGAGVVQQRLHRMTVEAPERDLAVHRQTLAAEIEWIKLFRPEQARLLDHARDVVFAHCACVEPSRSAFCHGDFGCCQVLHEAGSWSVVDFDQCVWTDPYWEIAKFMASLKRDVPLMSEWFVGAADRHRRQLDRACGAYLAGYERSAGAALDAPRLCWYRVGAEVHYVARLLKRDLAPPVAVDRGITLIDNLCRCLERRKA